MSQETKTRIDLSRTIVCIDMETVKSKKIALFGGTGFVGKHMRELLIKRGFQVQMLAAPSKNLESQNIEGSEQLRIIEGSLSQRKAISETLTGSDCCIVMTGPRSNSVEDMKTVVEGTRMIIEEMEAQGIKRLLKLSGVSVRLKDEPFPLPRRILDVGLGIAMKYPSRSKYLEQEIIEASSLDWTVVRPPVIRPGYSTKPIRSSSSDFLGLFVSVENLCDFFHTQIDSQEWVGRSPTVGQSYI